MSLIPSPKKIVIKLKNQIPHQKIPIKIKKNLSNSIPLPSDMPLTNDMSLIPPKKIVIRLKNPIPYQKIRIKFNKTLPESISSDMQEIIQLFMNNVKGRTYTSTLENVRHSGKEGHWLEKQMNIKPNCSNKPDICGYEMKKNCKKITFGDYSASEYLHSVEKPTINMYNNWDNNKVNIDRIKFIQFFGMPNPQKHNRYSWSGHCVPKYGIWNDCGQKLDISDNGDICVYYSYSNDKRENKQIIMPDYMKKDNLLVVVWKKEKMEKHINDKFNNKGFFICKKKNNVYDKICFGKPFDYNYFLEGIRDHQIIFDSGMYQGNARNYSQFRSYDNKFWENLIYIEY